MKRFLCVCLTVAMLLTVGVVGASAANAGADANDYSENLIVYWDFEPTGGGKLADKATAGSYEDTLIEVQSPDVELDYYNGKVTIPQGAGACMYQDNSKTTTINELGNITTQMTIGVKVKIDNDTNNTSTWILSRAASFDLYAKQSSAGKYSLIYRQESSSSQYFNFGGTKFDCGTEYYIFITVKKNEDATTTITGYWSTDGINFENQKTSNAVPLTNTVGKLYNRASTNLTLGSTKTTKASAAGVDITLDDVWIFNAAVSADSLPVIVKNRFSYTDAEKSELPAFRGLQTSPIDENNEYKIRFVGTVDSLNYAEVGFEIKITDYDGKAYKAKQYFTNTVYDEILGTENGNQISYTAKDLGGTYIFALALGGFPASAEGTSITMEIKPCYKTSSDGEVQYGEDAYRVTVNNGRVTEKVKI